MAKPRRKSRHTTSPSTSLLSEVLQIRLNHVTQEREEKEMLASPQHSDQMINPKTPANDHQTVRFQRTSNSSGEGGRRNINLNLNLGLFIAHNDYCRNGHVQYQGIVRSWQKNARRLSDLSN